MLPARDVDCSEIAVRPALRRSRTGPSQSEMQRSLSRLEYQEAELDSRRTGENDPRQDTFA